MVGTGQLLSTGDVISANVQTFYAILDGTAGGFNAVSTPITRSNLTPVTDVTQGITLPTTSKGWYYDLGTSAGTGYRVVVNPVAYDGIVAFSALLTSGNACSPSGNTEVYAVNYATAKSVIQASATSTTVVPYYSVPSAVTSEKIFTNNGTPELVVGCNAANCMYVPPINFNTAITTRLLNWREIPTAE
jgi:type IV pilus assembly protein PilY1